MLAAVDTRITYKVWTPYQKENHQHLLARCKKCISDPLEFELKIISLSNKLYKMYPDIIPTKLYSYYIEMQRKYEAYLQYTNFSELLPREIDKILTYLAHVSDQTYEYFEQISMINSWKFRFCRFLLPYTDSIPWLHERLEMIIDDMYCLIKVNLWDFIREMKKLNEFLIKESKSSCLIDYLNRLPPLKLGIFFSSEEEWNKCLEFADYVEDLIKQGKYNIPFYLKNLRNRSKRVNPYYYEELIKIPHRITTIEGLKQLLKID